MGIISPILLWKGFDRRALDLSEDYVYTRVYENYQEKALYFDGDITTDGRTRIYAQLFTPKIVDSVVIYFPESNEGVDIIPTFLLDKNIAVLKVDYMGEGLYPRFTVYPKSLYYCKGHINPELIYVYPTTEVKSCWYEWTKIGLRCITLVEKLFPGIPIGAYGLGLGGATTFKLGAIDNSIKASTTALNILPKLTGSADSMINYRAALDNNSYAPLLKSPSFVVLVSNDMDNSLDEMAELAKNTPMIVALRIVEKATRANLAKANKEIMSFFSKYLLNENIEINAPVLSAKNSDSSLYFEIKTKSVPVSINLFVAFSIKNSAYRNWQELKLQYMGENEYLAKTDVFEIAMPIYSFANIKLESGIIVSSNMLTLYPKEMSIKESVVKKNRVLYDSDNLEDNWLSFNSNYGIHMENGPFGISGVTCDANELATFKIGDYKYKANSDSILQLIINGEPQELIVTVTTKNSKNYSCAVKIIDPKQWTKLTLSFEDFKSNQGTLAGWDDIVMLGFSGQSHFIINSILWV